MAELSGCTASLLLVQDDYLVVANVGDSPVFVFRDLQNNGKIKGEQISVDHKPDDEEEQKRIISYDGILD